MKYFLIIDVDNCTLSSLSPYDHCISEAILDFAKQKRYAGFYICTHRCALTTPYVLTEISKHYSKAKKEPKNILLTAVAKNFAKATGLSCQGISTPDDINGPVNIVEQCTSGFNNLIKVIERTGEFPQEAKQLPVTKIDDDSKNLQLLQIAHHIRHQFPHEKIALHFVDDKKSICENALRLNLEDLWPRQLHLSVYHYDASQGKKIVLPFEMVLNPKAFADAEPYLIFHGKRKVEQTEAKVDYTMCVIS